VEGEWLDLTFHADSDSFKLGPGVVYYGKDKEDYASQAFCIPRAKVILDFPHTFSFLSLCNFSSFFCYSVSFS